MSTSARRATSGQRECRDARVPRLAESLGLRVDDHRQTEQKAVSGEGNERLGLEVVAQEANREYRRHRGDRAGDGRLTTYPAAQMAEQVGELDEARGEDDRGGQQEG